MSNMDALKCCGNCKFRDALDNLDKSNRILYSDYCLKEVNMPSWCICELWEHDGYNQLDRIILAKKYSEM